MPFIGNQPALSYTSFAKQDFTTSVTTSYTLDNPVANANELALFINFVRQEPTTAYTACGTSLTLTSATSATDDMYCVYLGKAVQTVNPPNGSVGTSQITDGAVTSAKIFSGFANGITEADQWRLTANITGTNGFITANLERIDTSGQGTLGTGMTESSGVFSFPSTGIYLVTLTAKTNADGEDNITMQIEATTNNSTYTPVAETTNGFNNALGNLHCSSLIDVTDTSNVKIKFDVLSLNASSYIDGDTSLNKTFFTFIRLGDT